MSCPINESALASVLKSGSANAFFNALQVELCKNFNIKLLTFTQIDMAKCQAKRLFSSNDTSYAIGGLKPIEINDWTKQVIKQQQAFIAHKHSDLAKVFFDHVLIAELGLGSVINWPVIIQSEVIGTVNLLAEEGAYLHVDLDNLAKLTPWFSISFLHNLQLRNDHD